MDRWEGERGRWEEGERGRWDGDRGLLLAYEDEGKEERLDLGEKVMGWWKGEEECLMVREGSSILQGCSGQD